VRAKDKQPLTEPQPSEARPGEVHRSERHPSEAHQSRSPSEAHPSERHASRPLLLVDIDGVISLFGFAAPTGSPAASDAARSTSWPAVSGARPEGSFHWIDGIPHFLSSRAAEHLLALAPKFELVWASGWEEKANEYLPHLLGLPELPHLSFERSVGRTNAHWKLDAIDAYARDRQLAWIDDAFNDACHEWAARRSAPTLLVQTQPASGLTQRETEILLRWAD
jgi:hypothetical protein